MTRIGVDLVTKMHDGKHMGSYLHRVRATSLLPRPPLLTFTLRAQECALIYYKANPPSLNGGLHRNVAALLVISEQMKLSGGVGGVTGSVLTRLGTHSAGSDRPAALRPRTAPSRSVSANHGAANGALT